MACMCRSYEINTTTCHMVVPGFDDRAETPGGLMAETDSDEDNGVTWISLQGSD
jgi:hypothetical protein